MENNKLITAHETIKFGGQHNSPRLEEKKHNSQI
jgi:hypothetical protein